MYESIGASDSLFRKAKLISQANSWPILFSQSKTYSVTSLIPENDSYELINELKTVALNWNSFCINLTHFLNLKWLISSCSTPLIKKLYCFMLAIMFVFMFIGFTFCFIFSFRPFTSKRVASHQISLYFKLSFRPWDGVTESSCSFRPSASGCLNDCIDFPLKVMQPGETEDCFSRAGC